FEVVLYQAGYLTIDKMIIDEDLEEITYKLKLPNMEVKKSLNDSIISALTKNNNPNQHKLPVIKALKRANLEDLKVAIVSIFASIANDNYRKNDIYHYEGFYGSVLYTYFQALGCDVIGEDVTNHGRIDLTIKINNLIYIVEFKMGDDDAMAQIKEKNYADKYLSLKQDIYLVGINFDEKKKNVSRFEWEKV
ncbi:MAG: PD-(D/E)XK nuclease domain-containing protein, partial [Sulfurimonas sp.]|nr:PD-(D/E)XK nuclease domain-containing protein [Sulfurimonas sp.]